MLIPVAVVSTPASGQIIHFYFDINSCIHSPKRPEAYTTSNKRVLSTHIRYYIEMFQNPALFFGNVRHVVNKDVMCLLHRRVPGECVFAPRRGRRGGQVGTGGGGGPGIWGFRLGDSLI